MTEARRVALVTGGTRGIGLGIARALATEGFDLAVNGIRPDREAAAAVAELQAKGAEVVYLRADVADAADRQALVAAALGRFGRLDVLVNNAGVAPLQRADLFDATEESFDRLISVNVKGAHFLTQIVARHMADRHRSDRAARGVVVNVSSVSATMASPNRGEYCISKAALAMSSKLWALRLAEEGIDVYEVRPGIIETDMTAAVKEAYDRRIAEGLIPERRWGLPEDVGRAVLSLARGDLSYATGQVVVVDGGLSIERL
jgi:3-oxoacyl-[acyl-carrier protein] reductase